MIQRYVAQRKCPNDCKEKDAAHKHQFIVRYHIPSIGIISADGNTEEEADKEAKIKTSEAISIFYNSSLKNIMEIEKLLGFK